MALVHVALRLEVPDSLLQLDLLDDKLCGEYGDEAAQIEYEKQQEIAEQIVVDILPDLMEYAIPIETGDVEVDF